MAFQTHVTKLRDVFRDFVDFGINYHQTKCNFDFKNKKYSKSENDLKRAIGAHHKES